MTTDLFLESIQNTATRKAYRVYLNDFMDKADIEDLAKTPAKEIQTRLIEYVISLKVAKNGSYSRQNQAVSAVTKFCQAYDIEGINWKKVRSFMSNNDSVAEDQPYTLEQARKMLEGADLRKKTLVLVLLTTGVRISAVPDIRLKDLEKVKTASGTEVYKVVVYAKSKKSRYVTFMTPETTNVVADYLRSREFKGETIGPDSPLIRDAFTEKNASKPIAVKSGALSRMVELMQKLIGLRSNHSDNGRFSVAPNHGFRKAFATALAKAKVDPLNRELMMGHDVGLHKTYERIPMETLLEEYVKAIPLLTVSNEKALQIENERLKLESKDATELHRQYMEDFRAKIELQGNVKKLTGNVEHFSELADTLVNKIWKLEAKITKLENGRKSEDDDLIERNKDLILSKAKEIGNAIESGDESFFKPKPDKEKP